MIGFVGSVFSPYYAAARRRARRAHGDHGSVDPEQHCAINIGLYGPGRDHWAMTERSGRHVHRDRDHFVVGPSSMCWEDDGLTVLVDELCMPIPRRLRGRIRLEPRALTGHRESLDAHGRHVWRPLAPLADIRVDFEQPDLHWSGSGYLDMNHGSEPLEDGFRHWTWARGDRDAGGRSAAVIYDATRRDGSTLELGLQFDDNGAVGTFPAPPVQPLTTTLWRVARSTRSQRPETARVLKTFEDTPFYARSSVEARLDGAPIQMVHEALDLDRFASRWVQTLLPFRMPRRS